MKKHVYLGGLILVLFLSPVSAQKKKRDPKLSEVWTDVSEVTVDKKGVPSDAIILWNGKGTSEFVGKDGKSIKWKQKGKTLTVEPGSGAITTKKSFGSCQLHLEFRISVDKVKTGQNSGNSGIYLQKNYEIQILNSYKNKTYSNGQLGAVYKQGVPLVNPAKPMGKWQVYDILFTEAKWKNGVLESKAKITAFINGVLVQNDFEIQGSTVAGAHWNGMEPSYTDHGKLPLFIQDHNEEVSFRNIWIREL